MMRTPRTALAVFALTASGCGGIIHRVEPAQIPVETPQSFSRLTSDSEAAPDGGPWWQSFDSRELSELVQDALGGNFDLVQAYARLKQAQAAERVAFAGYSPTVSASARYTGTRIVQPFLPEPIDAGQFDLASALSYELDLWGRVAHTHRAQNEEMQATSEDLETAHISVAAQVAETYFQVVEQRVIEALLTEQLQVSETFLELTELRFDQGITTGLDVFQQRNQVESVRAQFPPVRAALAVAEHQLAVLLGQPPGVVQVSAQRLPGLPPFPEVGVPSTVLLNRPDVQAARHRATAQDHRIGAAVAEYFPRFTLDASLGFRSFNGFQGLFDDFVYNVAGQVAGNLFEGGRRKAEVRRNRALLEERLAAFAQQVLVALQEVEDALVQERQQQERLARLQAQLETAQATLQEARLQYVNGLSDFLPVLTALQAQQEAERQVVGARRLLLARRVQLHRALGGRISNVVPPEDSKESPS